MNLKTTLVLLVLVAAIGALITGGVQLPPGIIVFPKETQRTDLGSLKILASLTPESIERITIRTGNETTQLQRNPDRSWALPGNWPIRSAEVDRIVQLIGTLRSRYKSIPLDDLNQSRFGMDSPKISVDLMVSGQSHHLDFAEPEGWSNRYELPVYLRIDGKNEILRLAPGILDLLNHPLSYYQQRRIFPSQRIAREGNATQGEERLPNKPGQSLELRNRGEGEESYFSLQSDGKTWNLTEPGKDRTDPTTLQNLVSGLADIWSERFVTQWSRPAPPIAFPLYPTKAVQVTSLIVSLLQPQVGNLSAAELAITTSGDTANGLSPLFAAPMLVTSSDSGLAGILTSLGWISWTLPQPDLAWKLSETGLDNPERTIVFTTHEGKRIALQIGRLARKSERKQMQPGPINPMGIPSPPIETTIPENYYFARLDGSDRIFEIRDDRLAQIFVPIDRLRDAHVLNTAVDKVQKIELKFNEKAITLFKESSPGSKETWKIDPVKPINADSSQISNFLQGLISLEARGGDVLYQADLKTLGLDPPSGEVNLTVSDDKTQPDKIDNTKQIRMRIGKEIDGKLAIYDPDSGRINLVPVRSTPGKDSILSQIQKPIAAWRAKKLMDLSPNEIANLTIKHPDRTTEAIVINRTNQKWVIQVGDEKIEPDQTRITQLTDALNNLEANTFITNNPFTWIELGSQIAYSEPSLGAVIGHLALLPFFGPNATETLYGFQKPRLQLNYQFNDPRQTEVKLEVGNPTPDRKGVFARLSDDPTVFTINPDLLPILDVDVLASLPKILWQVNPNQIESLTIHKPNQSDFTLLRDESNWKLKGETDATADLSEVNKLISALATLQTNRYLALNAKDLANYGLEQPQVEIKLTWKADGQGNASEHFLSIGKPTETPEGVFARIDANRRIFVLDNKVATLLQQNPIDYVDRQILRLNPAKIEVIRRTDANGIFQMQRRETGWVITKPTETSTDEKDLEALINSLGNLRALRVVTVGNADLKQYSLDKPIASIEMELPNDPKSKRVTMNIGKAVSNENKDYYAQVQGKPGVFVLPGELATKLLANPIRFRDRLLVNLRDFDSLRLERDRRQATFSQVNGSWILQEPIQGEANNSMLDDFLALLSRLRADEFVQEKPGSDDLKRYGLDRAEIRYRVLAKNKEVLDLQVGALEKNSKRRFARLGNRDLVFLLDPKLTTLVEDEFRPRTLWEMPLDVAQVNQISYKAEGASFALERKGGDWKLPNKPEVLINSSAINSLLSSLAGLKIQRYIIDKDADLQLYGIKNPQLIISLQTATRTFGLRIGNRFGESKARYAQLDQPGKTDVFLISETDADQIVKDLKSFLVN